MLLCHCKNTIQGLCGILGFVRVFYAASNSNASCTSEQQKHNISGFDLLPSQSVAGHDAALTNRCVTAFEKKPLDASCKYLTVVNVIACKVIFKCSFKHPHNGLAAF